MKKFVVRTYELRKNQKSGPGAASLRFAFLTDLHSVENGEQNSLLLKAMEKENTDAVLCGGDMIVGKPGQTPDTALRLMEQLRKRWPVIHAMGNHEYRAKIYPEVYGALYERYRSGLKACGVLLLDNQRREMVLKGRRVLCCGLSISREYYQRFQRRPLSLEQIQKQIGLPDREAVSILLAHNPLYLETYLKWGGNVTLCGHYHGGVLGLGKHRGLISPDFRIFPREARGLFGGENCWGIVGAGIGEHTIPVRIHNPRELVIFTV